MHTNNSASQLRAGLRFMLPAVAAVLLGLALLSTPAEAAGFAPVSVRDFGAVGDGVTDDTRAIQAALNTGRKVVIPEGVFVISNALEPTNNQELEIVGTVRVANANIQPLTADVAPGQPRVQVRDASRFYVGQWVLVGDESLPIQGGGPKVRREAAECGRIAAIEGNTIVMSHDFKKTYRISAQARLATQPSAILIEDKKNVRVVGSGTIDCNKARQYNFAPGMMDKRSEETRAGCGITVHANAPGSVSHITLQGITIRNAVLHNISFYGVADSVVLNVTCVASYDKNILLRGSVRCRIQGNLCLDAEWEDGIIVYSGNKHCLLAGNICAGNRRNGITVNAFQEGIALSGNLLSDNGRNLHVRGDHGSSTGDVSVGRGGVELGGRGNVVTGLVSSQTVNISATDLLWNGGTIGRREGDALDAGMIIKRTSTDYRVAPVNGVRIEGVRFVGCKTGVLVRGEIKNVRLVENDFNGIARPVDIESQARVEVTFARNQGFRTESRGVARIAAGEQTVRITHGLAIAPAVSDIAVTPASSLGRATSFWIGRPDDTGFTIHLNSAPEGSGVEFAWQIN